MANTLPDKLRNFSEHHHETLKISHKAKLEWWHNETVVKKERCARCWLRPWNCFCDQLEFKRLSRLANAQACGVNISIYYSHPEIGRSPNTAHVFEAICPTICSSFVYGEYEKERALLDSIEREHEEDTPCTCILYPSSDSITLSEWVARRNARNSELSNQPIRLVILDGTYPAASREAKYLVNCCRLRGINLPMVKLDLENGACKSAITGVMTQPSKDKICSYQAIVIALQQLGAGVGFCDDLHSDLQDWLTHILKTKVKLGKSQPRRSLRDVDNTPADYVKAILEQSPPPVNPGYKVPRKGAGVVKLTNPCGKASVDDVHTTTQSWSGCSIDGYCGITTVNSMFALEKTARFSVLHRI